MLRSFASFCGPAISEFQIQFMLKTPETFVQLATLIQWTEHIVRAFKAGSKSQHKLFWSNRAARFAI